MKEKLKAYITAIRGKPHAVGLVECDILTPKRDWYLILGGVSVLALSFVGFGLYVYYVSSAIHTSVVLDTAERSVPDVERLSRVLGGYRERNARFEALRGSYDTQKVLEPTAVSEEEVITQPAADKKEDEETTETVDLRS